MAHSDLLWSFRVLPDEYFVVDTETTGLFDGEIAPDPISIGLTHVVNRKFFYSYEFRSKPSQHYKNDSDLIHGIPWVVAQRFKSLSDSWIEISELVNRNLIISHNALFDWRVLSTAATRNGLKPLLPEGVLCSQRSSQPWAMANEIPCSPRGPSLDVLANFFDLTHIRNQFHEHHSASVDSKLTAIIVERLRGLAGEEFS